jgi:hypothetical protein
MKHSNRLIQDKIEKELQIGLLQIDNSFSEDINGFREDQFIMFMKMLGYIREGEEALVKPIWNAVRPHDEVK